MQVVIGLCDYEPTEPEKRSESVLPVRPGSRYLLIEAADDPTGWSKVIPLATDSSNETGFVPASFLERAPPDGTMISEFTGETDGEVESAAAGEVVWKVQTDAAAANDGWAEVILESGERGNVPEAFVEWTSQAAPPAAPQVQPPASQSIRVAVGLGSFEPSGSEELPVRPDERFLVLETAESSAGWTRAMSFERPALDGFVPAAFLEYIPPDGRMLEAFVGETLGEIASAEAGEPLWKVDAQAAATSEGWIDVYVASGKQGNVPHAFVEWEAAGRAIIAEPAASEPAASEPAARQASSQSAQEATEETAAIKVQSFARGRSAKAEVRAKAEAKIEAMAEAEAKAEAAKARPVSVGVGLGAFEPSAGPADDGVLRVRVGERFVVLEAADEPSGWSSVVSLAADASDGGAAGFVPASFLGKALPDGLMRSAFMGETAGEVAAAGEGELLWRLRPAASGWCEVLLERGERGSVPESYVEWTAGAAQEATEETAAIKVQSFARGRSAKAEVRAKAEAKIEAMAAQQRQDAIDEEEVEAYARAKAAKASQKLILFKPQKPPSYYHGAARVLQRRAWQSGVLKPRAEMPKPFIPPQRPVLPNSRLRRAVEKVIAIQAVERGKQARRKISGGPGRAAPPLLPAEPVATTEPVGAPVAEPLTAPVTAPPVPHPAEPAVEAVVAPTTTTPILQPLTDSAAQEAVTTLATTRSAAAAALQEAAQAQAEMMAALEAAKVARAAAQAEMAAALREAEEARAAARAERAAALKEAAEAREALNEVARAAEVQSSQAREAHVDVSDVPSQAGVQPSPSRGQLAPAGVSEMEEASSLVLKLERAKEEATAAIAQLEAERKRAMAEATARAEPAPMAEAAKEAEAVGTRSTLAQAEAGIPAEDTTEAVAQPAQTATAAAAEAAVQAVQAVEVSAVEAASESGGDGQRAAPGSHVDNLERQREWEEREAARRQAERLAYEKLEQERREAVQRAFDLEMLAKRTEWEKLEAVQRAALDAELAARKQELASHLDGIASSIASPPHSANNNNISHPAASSLASEATIQGSPSGSPNHHGLGGADATGEGGVGEAGQLPRTLSLASEVAACETSNACEASGFEPAMEPAAGLSIGHNFREGEIVGEIVYLTTRRPGEKSARRKSKIRGSSRAKLSPQRRAPVLGASASATDPNARSKLDPTDGRWPHTTKSPTAVKGMYGKVASADQGGSTRAPQARKKVEHQSRRRGEAGGSCAGPFMLTWPSGTSPPGHRSAPTALLSSSSSVNLLTGGSGPTSTHTLHQLWLTPPPPPPPVNGPVPMPVPVPFVYNGPTDVPQPLPINSRVRRSARTSN